MTRAVGVAFVAPSVTTYVNLNPGESVNLLNDCPSFPKVILKSTL